MAHTPLPSKRQEARQEHQGSSRRRLQAEETEVPSAALVTACPQGTPPAARPRVAQGPRKARPPPRPRPRPGRAHTASQSGPPPPRARPSQMRWGSASRPERERGKNRSLLPTPTAGQRRLTFAALGGSTYRAGRRPGAPAGPTLAGHHGHPLARALHTSHLRAGHRPSRKWLRRYPGNRRFRPAPGTPGGGMRAAGSCEVMSSVPALGAMPWTCCRARRPQMGAGGKGSGRRGTGPGCPSLAVRGHSCNGDFLNSKGKGLCMKAQGKATKRAYLPGPCSASKRCLGGTYRSQIVTILSGGA